MKKHITAFLIACALLCGCAPGNGQKAQAPPQERYAAQSPPAPEKTAENAAAPASGRPEKTQSPQPDKPKETAQTPKPTQKPAPTPGAGEETDQPPNTGGKPAAPDIEKKVSAVTISIFDDEGRVILESAAVEHTEGMTVVQALKSAARAGGILVKIKGRGAFSYIEGIGDLSEFDKGAKSGWLFSVNNVVASRGAGAVALSAGDDVKWRYTTTGEW